MFDDGIRLASFAVEDIQKEYERMSCGNLIQIAQR